MRLKKFFVIVGFENVLAYVANAIDIHICTLYVAQSPQLLQFAVVIFDKITTERQIENYYVIVWASCVAAILAAQEIFKMVLWETLAQTLNEELYVSFGESRQKAATRDIFVVVHESNEETRYGRSGLEKESASPKRTFI